MRRCLGAAFAQYEMRRVLRTVLEHTQLQPATDRAEPFERRPVTVVPRHGTPAVLTDGAPTARTRAAAARTDSQLATPRPRDGRSAPARVPQGRSSGRVETEA